MKTPASERLDSLETFCRSHTCNSCPCLAIDDPPDETDLCVVALATNALRAGADQ